MISIDEKWIFWAIPILWSSAIGWKTLRDLKGLSRKHQTRHDDLLVVLRSSEWSDSKEKQDSMAKLK